VIARFAELDAVESQARQAGLLPEDRRILRQQKSAPVMAALKALEWSTPDFSADNGGVIAPRTNWHALSRRAER
jgi:hypothetical protein